MFSMTRKNISQTGMVLLAGLLAAVTLSWPSSASAWEFDTCSSTLTSEVDLSTPQAMIMIDRSGSMASRIESPSLADPNYWWIYSGKIWPNNARSGSSSSINANWADPIDNLTDESVYSASFINQSPFTEPSWGWGEEGDCLKWGGILWLTCKEREYNYVRGFWFHYPGSLWDITIRELEEVLETYDSPSGARIKFGLGTFTTDASLGIAWGSSNWGRIWSEADKYTNAANYMKFFEHPQQGGPYGSTPTAAGIRAMMDSKTVSNKNTSNAGILITDGVPNYSVTGINAYDDAVNAACEHRDVAPMYVIGFSSGTDTAFNNLLAAAGGTGSCTKSNGAVVDPCSMTPSSARSELTCTGAYQADSGSEFQDALDSITNQIACTYPLDILNTPDGKAPTDPAGTRVFLGACTPGPGTHKVAGSAFNSANSTGSPYTTGSAPLGLSCTESCGAVNSSGNQLTYLLPTTPGQENIARVRVADYLHNCRDSITIEVRANHDKIGEWSGSGVNNWAIAEFPFTPTADQTWITVVQTNDAYCNGSSSCSSSCNPLAGDLNLYVDWVKVVDPEAGCQANGRVSYVAPGSSGSGWTFNEDRTQVRLVGNACAQIQNRQHDKVVTQVACPCEFIAGGACTSSPDASCPVGLWECTNEWEDICVPDTFCDDDSVCAPLTQHNTLIGQPNVQMVVDNSGSMASSSKHTTARDVLGELADWSYGGPGCGSDGTNCDKLRLGLHFWSTGKNTEISANEDTQKFHIVNAFNNNWPSGGTEFHQAIELLRDENKLKDANTPNIGIMVTDGVPNTGSTLPNSLKLTCQIRKRTPAPIATYVLGFGSGNAENVNSLVAAAGGTGQCCLGNGCTMGDPSTALDPCDYSTDDTAITNLASAVRYNGTFNGHKVQCDGNIPAADGEALKARLLELFENLQCTFPLTLLPDMESASSNPEGTRVGIYLTSAGDVVKVPHVDNPAAQAEFVAQLTAKGVPNAASFANEGWKFSNAGRTSIDLSPGLCDEIQNQTITRVDTQVCEACEQTGEACQVPCEPGVDAHCGEDGFLFGRCGLGEYICIHGQDVCAQTRNPMPEICNGIDDSCDGLVDNLSDNNTDWSEPQWSLTENFSGEFAALACHNVDICGCEGGNPDSINGSDGATEFFDHLNGQKSIQDTGAANCYCGAGLTAPASQASPTSSPSAPHADDAACSISGTRHSSPLDAWWLVGVFGLLGIGRAQRRYLNR